MLYSLTKPGICLRFSFVALSTVEFIALEHPYGGIWGVKGMLTFTATVGVGGKAAFYAAVAK